MATYDEQVLQGFVDELYQRARNLVIATAARYGFYAFALVLIASFALQKFVPADASLGVIWLIVIVVAVVAGIYEGRARGFKLRLEAQQVLLQMQIERNTRHLLSSHSAATPPTIHGQ